MNLVIFDKFIDHYVLKCGVIPFAFCLTVCPIAGFLSDIAWPIQSQRFACPAHTLPLFLRGLK